jgi:hypothetical protein
MTYDEIKKNYEYVLFGAWLERWWWQPYDGWDRWINTMPGHNEVVEITELYNEYLKESPE